MLGQDEGEESADDNCEIAGKHLFTYRELSNCLVCCFIPLVGISNLNKYLNKNHLGSSIKDFHNSSLICDVLVEILNFLTHLDCLYILSPLAHKNPLCNLIFP